ncbi:hypothetical protein BJX99DRAFT_240967 [Aspergillus californicus]
MPQLTTSFLQGYLRIQLLNHFSTHPFTYLRAIRLTYLSTHLRSPPLSKSTMAPKLTPTQKPKPNPNPKSKSKSTDPDRDSKPTAKLPPTDLPIHAFPTPSSFTTFLAENHSTSPGIHLKLAKKASGIPSITAPEAVEVALCFGWIDGRANPFDEKHWLVRYTPRRAKSMWSAKNVATVGRLIEEGRMTEAGLEAVDAAKGDGRWERAYDGPAGIEVPGDLAGMLDEGGNEEAKRVFGGLSRSERYMVLHRLQTAAVKGRESRVRGVVEMLGRGEVAMSKSKTVSDGAVKGKASRVQKNVKGKVEKAKIVRSNDQEASVSVSTRRLRSRKPEISSDS